MIKYFRHFFLIAILLNIISCTQKSLHDFSKIFPSRPNQTFAGQLRNASPEFRQGWEDGCNAGMSAGSNVFYKMFYQSNAVDGYKTMESPEYSEAWFNAMWFCYRTDQIKNGSQFSGIWKPFFTGYR